mmetsp:Transcript_5452/g.15610  ORF Transcript_5452/g.15610 Transcript_5452/m.15610 type:complete len:233 (-) Transcript_5452:1137-1835(-)
MVRVTLRQHIVVLLSQSQHFSSGLFSQPLQGRLLLQEFGDAVLVFLGESLPPRVLPGVLFFRLVELRLKRPKVLVKSFLSRFRGGYRLPQFGTFHCLRRKLLLRHRSSRFRSRKSPQEILSLPLHSRALRFPEFLRGEKHITFALKTVNLLLQLSLLGDEGFEKGRCLSTHLQVYLRSVLHQFCTLAELQGATCFLPVFCRGGTRDDETRLRVATETLGEEPREERISVGDV